MANHIPSKNGASSTCTSSSFPNNTLSPLAKLMMEQKHSHSAKCLSLSSSSPLHYDSPLLRRNAKVASAELLQKMKQQEKVGQRMPEHDEVDGKVGSGSLDESYFGTSATSIPKRSPGVNYDDQDVNCTVFEVEEWGSKRWIRVEVIEPVTITAKNFLHVSTSFTSYLIRIETNHYAFSLPVSEVRRRYSEFRWLRTKLTHTHPNKVVPPLPPKHFFNITNFNETIINQRRYGLGKFLQRVFRSSVLLSDSALHLFLQSDLSTKEIDARVSEEQEGGIGSSNNNNNIPLTAAISIDKNPITYKRPYLFRSISLSSASEGEGHGTGTESEGSDDHGKTSRIRNSDDDHHEDYCDISSSEEYEIDVEACP